MSPPSTSKSMDLRYRAAGLLALLVMANIGAWLWAFSLFHSQPLMIGAALLAWGLGLRHAVDADHIAAIDNVTRKLVQDGQKPLMVGFWFAAGHSSIVIIGAVALALVTSAMSEFEALKQIGGAVATTVSAVFLFTIAAMNLIILRSVWRTFAHVRAGGTYVEKEVNLLLGSRGLLARLFRPVFRLISRSWHMARWAFCSASASIRQPKLRFSGFLRARSQMVSRSARFLSCQSCSRPAWPW